MESLKKTIYLGKSGLSHGPFSQDELQTMRANGTIQQYHWIWDASQYTWMPLDPPPPPLALATGDKKRSTPSTAIKLGKRDKFDTVICHNFRDVIVGQITQIDEWGCSFVTAQESPTPKLALQALVQVHLSIAASTSGRTMSIKGTLLRARFDRATHQWTYQLQWRAEHSATEHLISETRKTA